MILYNLRFNGPYEYDKLILNVFQLYNLVEEEKEKYAAHSILKQLSDLNNISIMQGQEPIPVSTGCSW